MEFMTADKARKIQDESIRNTKIDYEIGYIDSLIENAAIQGFNFCSVYNDSKIKGILKSSIIKNKKVYDHYTSCGFKIIYNSSMDIFDICWDRI